MDLLKSLKNKLYSRISRHITHATLVEGNLKGSNQLFRCLFVENSNLMEYLSPKIFESKPRIINKQRVLMQALKGKIQSCSHTIDICIAVLPKTSEMHFDNIYKYKSQEWIKQTLDTNFSIDEAKKRFNKKSRDTQRLIRKYNFSCRISTKYEDLHNFYYSMYLPLQDKFGSVAYVDSYEEMEDYFARGFLIIINDGCKEVSGGLCYQKGSALIFRRMGVLEGDKDYIKRGIQSVLYYYVINYAVERKIELVDFMSSRAFFNDGIYKTKREWGANVKPDDESETWVYFFIPNYTEKIVNFFEKNPVIGHTDNGLNVIMGWKGRGNITEVEKKELTKRHCVPGLDGLQLITLDSKKIIKCHFNNKAT